MSHTPTGGGQASDQASAVHQEWLLEVGVGQIKPKTHEVSQIVGHDTDLQQPFLRASKGTPHILTDKSW